VAGFGPLHAPNLHGRCNQEAKGMIDAVRRIGKVE
jgi:hypothetical protein